MSWNFAARKHEVMERPSAFRRNELRQFNKLHREHDMVIATNPDDFVWFAVVLMMSLNFFSAKTENAGAAFNSKLPEKSAEFHSRLCAGKLFSSKRVSGSKSAHIRCMARFAKPLAWTYRISACAMCFLHLCQL